MLYISVFNFIYCLNKFAFLNSRTFLFACSFFVLWSFFKYLNDFFVFTKIANKFLPLLYLFHLKIFLFFQWWVLCSFSANIFNKILLWLFNAFFKLVFPTFKPTTLNIENSFVFWGKAFFEWPRGFTTKLTIPTDNFISAMISPSPLDYSGTVLHQKTLS